MIGKDMNRQYPQLPKEGDPDPTQSEEAKLNPIPYAVQNIVSVAVRIDPASSTTTKVPLLPTSPHPSMIPI